MDFRPVFRCQPSSAELTLQPSSEAGRVAAGVTAGTTRKIRTAAQAMKEAKARVIQAGGDSACSKLVFSQTEIQFGEYAGQTFQWLLGHDVGWVVKILASHQKERETDTSHTPLMANKDSLQSYAQMFPRMVAAVRVRRATEGTVTARANDQEPVTLAQFYGKGVTYQALYESTDEECRSYVQFLRRTLVTHAGSGLGKLQAYVLARDKEEAELVPAAAEAPTLRHSTRATSARRLTTEEEDMELVAAAEELEARAARAPTPASATSASSSSAAALGPGELVTRPPASGAEMLPKGWRATLPVEQHEWLGRAMFRWTGAGTAPKCEITDDTRMWWFPPAPQPIYTQPPASASVFFLRPFFLWMPRRRLAFPFVCRANRGGVAPCGGPLKSAGFYQTVRRVLNVDGWYYMGTQYLECATCHKKVAAWAPDVLEQLDLAHQREFPAVLTYKLSCDKRVIAMMKERTLGNSPTRLQAQLKEQHTKEWRSRTLLYRSVVRKFPHFTRQSQVTVPPMPPVPSVPWLLSITRLAEMDEEDVIGPSAELTAAVVLPPAQALQREAVHPDQPYGFHLPEDASGLAVSRRRPLAPAAPAVASVAAGSPSALHTPAPPTSADTSGPSGTITSTLSSTVSSAPSATIASFSATYMRKKKRDAILKAREAGASVNEPRLPQQFLCKKCGFPKNKEHGHSRYRSEHYCSKSGELSAEEWLAQKRRADPKK